MGDWSFVMSWNAYERTSDSKLQPPPNIPSHRQPDRVPRIFRRKIRPVRHLNNLSTRLLRKYAQG